MRTTRAGFGNRGSGEGAAPAQRAQARRRLQKSADARLGKLAGAAPEPRKKTGVRKIGWEESPAARKIRMRAKTVNFTCTIFARGFIIFGAFYYLWDFYQTSHIIHRGVLFIIFAMFADLGRVLNKMSTPGTK